MRQADRAINRRTGRVLGPEAAHLGDEAEKFGHRHLGVGGRALGQVAQFALNRHGIFRDVDTVHRGPAGIRTEEAGEHLHGGGLPGPVGPEEAQDVPAFDGKADAVDRAFLSVGFNESFDFDHGVFRKAGGFLS